MRKRGTDIRQYFLKSVNPVIRFLILSDTVFIGATGLLGPVFAFFIEEFIEGGGPAVAGTAVGIYLFFKSVLQIPIAHLIDKIRGEKDDFWLMFVSTILSAFVPLSYLFIKTPLQLYFVQFMLGLLAACIVPAYMAIFTRHIDKNKEGMEWGIYFTLVDLCGALLAFIGGYIATYIGFRALILIVILSSFLGALLLWPIKPYIKKTRALA